ncbi:hypothetical protein L3Q82_021090 [Scortum barcoo]|uniref:Uncharacterized protein n=1 Tax=Scortum barcoo TaxID=214431 RepID=A0ACB8X5U4_9TELE|nr:hypothetical protein L3Q82_021090 [Scortum barcoo]
MVLFTHGDLLKGTIQTAMTGLKHARLRVILGENNTEKLTLPNGIPDSIDELLSKVKDTFGLKDNIRLRYIDEDFGNGYFNLISTTKLKDLGTIKWPEDFPVPRFSYDTELQLEKGNTEYQINAEFQRLVALPLEQTFLAQLDKYSDQFIHIIQAKGGATREKTANIIQTLDQVLAPFLFTLYTADFSYNTPSCHLQKFSDDSAVVGLITDGDDREYKRTYSGLCGLVPCGTTSRSTLVTLTALGSSFSERLLHPRCVKESCAAGEPHRHAVSQYALYRATMKGHQQFLCELIFPDNNQFHIFSNEVEDCSQVSELQKKMRIIEKNGGLIVHEGAAVYNVFMRWRAVNLHWDVQSYDKAKDMEETSTGHSSLTPRTLWLPLVTFGPNGPLHPTQLGPQPWTCLCLAPFCPGLVPRNNLSQDSDSGEVVIRVTSV